jgi:hypothetical protein
MSACPDLETDVTLDEAHGILQPFFESVRDLYVEEFPLVEHVELYVARDAHDTPRHFAGCSETGKKIVAAPEMVELPHPFVLGILAHELGHSVDFLYPGEFALGRGGVIRRERAAVTDGQWTRWFKAWEERDPDVVEQTADQIAERVWGLPIGYAGPCKLQNFRTGEARPQGLR